MSATRLQWTEIARRGKALPLLVIDSVVCLYRDGYFGKAHQVDWNPQNYRQFDNARWFGVKDQKHYQAILERASYLASKPSLLDYAAEYNRRIDAYRTFGKQKGLVNYSKANYVDLATTFAEWFEHTKRIWSFALDYIMINKFLPDRIVAAIASKIPDVDEQNELLRILFTADQVSEIGQEKRHMLELARALRANNIRPESTLFRPAIHKHLEQFAHLGFYYFHGAAYSEEHIINRLKHYNGLSDAEFMIALSELEDPRDVQRKAEFTIKRLQLSPQIIYEIQAVKRWAATSNHVDETYSFVVHHLHGLWDEICQRFDISFEQFYSLGGEEIIAALHKGVLAESLKQQTAMRIKNHALILEDGKRHVLINDDLAVYVKHEKASEQDYSGIKELKGQPASPGQARGCVRIIFSVSDIRNVSRGDILVASATNPTYVPAMEKAGAIVTDEGGLLSHAAIVSRELKVPAIVGTKIATKVLKDGDMVEVDAHKGVVRKI